MNRIFYAYLHAGFLRIRRFWDHLIQPLPTVQDVGQRRQSRLVSAMLIAFMAFIIIGYQLPALLGQSEIDVTGWAFSSAALALFFIAYQRSRAGHYRQAAWIFIATFILAILALAIVNRAQAGYYLLYYLLLPVFFGSLLLQTRTLILMIVSLAVFMMLLPALFSEFHMDDIPLLYFLSFSIIVMLFARHRDLLERDRRKQLSESEVRYRLLFETVSEPIVVLEDGVYLDVNAAYTTLFQMPREIVIGRHVVDLSEDPNRTKRELEALSEETQEVMARRADGSELRIEVRSKSYRMNARTMAVVAIHDLTERYQAEQARLALALEQEKVNLMRNFINDLSHDFRTPLTIIRNSLYLFQNSRSEDRRAHHLQLIDLYTERLVEMVESLLTVTRLEKAANELYEFTVGDLNLVTRAVAEEQQPFALSKALPLHIELARGLLPVRLDLVEIQRALRQIIINAVNYTRAGSITVRTYQRDQQAVVEVQDTGMGIAPEDSPRIFEMFYRADPARNIDQGGLGMGLFIARRIVEAHDGQIEVESKLNEGSTFRITLAIAQPEMSAPDS
ncbi:MAG: PAS domain-containing sensor histidine kinase [bacterium]|nr:PAS domain-containing sensor histidine kinase [bacterium]